MANYESGSIVISDSVTDSNFLFEDDAEILGHKNYGDEGNESNSFVLKSKCYLEYTGEAEDKDSSGKERQYCRGELSICDYVSKAIVKDENGEDLIFEAISGPGFNGLLPNGEYIVTPDEEIPKLPPFKGEFTDENGFSFKMRLKPKPPFPPHKKYKVRGGLLIHPVRSLYYQDPAPPNYRVYGKIYYGVDASTDGCIGLCESWKINQKFYNLIQPYLMKNHDMLLVVNVDKNYNLKHQIGAANTYKDIY